MQPAAMHPRIQEVFTTLDTELALLREAVDQVPVERRSERPSPQRWSVAEILEHLAMTEAVVLKACSRQLAVARESGLPAETHTSPIRPMLPPERVANRERSIDAPVKLVPTGIDADAAWRQIEEVRERFREFVATCDGLALGHVSFPHPAFGSLDMYQWLLFAAGHHTRHAAQIREVAVQLASTPPNRGAAGAV